MCHVNRLEAIGAVHAGLWLYVMAEIVNYAIDHREDMSTPSEQVSASRMFLDITLDRDPAIAGWFNHHAVDTIGEHVCHDLGKSRMLCPAPIFATGHLEHGMGHRILDAGSYGDPAHYAIQPFLWLAAGSASI